MYRTIDTKIWSDPKFRQLTKDERIAFVYLVTNQHTHLSGLYYLPIPLATYETCLSDKEYRKAIDTLSRKNMVQFDEANNVIWVVNMFRYQANGSKSIIATKNQIKSLHNTMLTKKFASYYSDTEWGIDALSIPNPSGTGTESGEVTEKEQEQDIAPNDVPSSPPTPFTEFIFTNWESIKDIHKWESVIAETYPPEFDYLQSCRNARVWIANNPKKAPRSDFKRFIGAWIARDYETWRKTVLPSQQQSKHKSSIPTTGDESYLQQLKELGIA